VRSRLAVAIALALVGGACHARGSPPTARDADAPVLGSTAPAPQGIASISSQESAAVTVALPGASAIEMALAGPRHRFRKTALTTDDLARLVSASPELARIGAEPSFFDVGDNQYLLRSKAAREDITFTTVPLLWSPEPGTELLVVTGRGKATSFIAAWWLLPGGQYRLASSFIMLGEIAPVALAYKRDEPDLWWTSCWQCPGETGHLSLREDRHVVIVQD